eukprot:jgi/Chrpa1/6184/Chrysochromulina_OHIO_Genome00014714-RA
MVASLVCTAAMMMAWLATPPPMEQLVVAPRPAVLSSSVAAFSIFPTTTLAAGLGDFAGLDDFAAEQAAKEAAFQAKKDALKRAQQEQEEKAAAEYEKAQKTIAEREAKKLAAIEDAKAKKAAAAAAAAEKKVVASGEKKSTGATSSDKKSKYAVQTVNKQAERIAAREASGEEKPSLFGL